MSKNVTAEIVAVGTEILLGEITDTNSVFLARTFRDLGVNVHFMTTVGDNVDRIESAIRLALGRADIVITCGGLGPTIDDMTRQAVAAATDRGLAFHQSLLDAIAERFTNYHAQMTENNKRQAYLPEDSIIIENPVGTAPSFAVEQGDKVVISLPGVPREMKFLMNEKVIPLIRQKFDLVSDVILAKILKTAGVGESSLDDMLGKDLLELSNPTIGLAAHSGQIDIRMTAKASDHDTARQMIAELEEKVRVKAGQYIFGSDDDRLEDVLVALLKSHDAQLGIIEAGIGNVLGERLPNMLDTPQLTYHEQYESPQALRVVINTETDSLRELATKASKHILTQDKITLAIAIISNPNIDENPDVNEGTAIAVATKRESRIRVYGFGGKSEDAKQFAGNWSLAIAWLLSTQLLNSRR